MNNEKRAERARRAVVAYWDGGPEELPTQVGDLICDLLHLLDTHLDPSLGIPEPPPELDSGYRNPHGGSTEPVVVLARGLNHYLAEIHPDALVDGNRGEDAPFDPLPADVERAVKIIGEFLRG